MIEFWILALLLLFPGLLILVPALLHPRIRIAEDLNQRNLQIARERLAELEASRKEGALGDEAFDQAKAELEGNLLDDLREAETKALDNRPASLSLALILILVPLVVILLYQQLGSPEILARLASNESASELHHQGETKMDELLAKLEEKLKLNPDNPEGWFILGRSYMTENKYDKAVWALEETIKRLPNNPTIMVTLADALTMANGGKFTPRSEELLHKAQSIDPSNAISFWLLGMAYYERGRFTDAISQWRGAMPLLQDSPESVQKIGSLIEEAKAKGGEDKSGEDKGAAAVIAAQTSEQTAAPNKGPDTDIRVWVSLAPELAAKTTPADTLFVLAKAASGPAMPLAVARHQVSELPLEVSLTDAMAMMPQLKLSNFDQVLVQARIAKGGEPTAKSGDLESEAKASTTKGQQGLELVINKEVP